MKRFPKSLNTSGRKESVLDETRLLVAFKEVIDLDKVQQLAQELKLTVETSDRQDKNKHWVQVNNTRQRYWLRTADSRPIQEEEFIRIERAFDDRIDWIGPVYKSRSAVGLEHYFCPVPNVLIVKKSNKEPNAIAAVFQEFGLEIDEAKSRYLTAHQYLRIRDVKRFNAFEIKQRLQQRAEDVKYENMPMLKPLAAVPNDTLWMNQWDMTQINAPAAWDISTGANTVVICVLDEGCDLTHPDLQFSEEGINLGTMMPTGAPTGNHGTACAGIAAATFNNNEGLAGVAGNCRIMPVAFENWTDVEVANGINYATTNGAAVISMSFGVYDDWTGNLDWDHTIIDPEIENAFTNNVVMCAATGNEDRSDTNRYPARHPLIIAVGGSSTDDNRKTTTSPDGESWWGANYGEDVYDGTATGVSVVAPCVLCPTTDRQGADGYQNGNYINNFNGTSSATPHVAGFAALLKSQYPALSNVQIRNIIEKTAAKVGTLPYSEQAGFPNGTRNQEMGYGRIDMLRALDFSDVMIKDWAGDTGSEPSTSGNFWDFSDIVVRITDDNVFNPSNPSQSKNVEKGQPNFIYVRVTNNGPREARNVTVACRITPYIGTQFIYPADWTTTDAMHVAPAPVTNTFTSVPSGGSVMAKFTISAAQTNALYGWQADHPWHPCLLASVTADNDFAFASGTFTTDPVSQRKNNLAQRNLAVIDVLGDMAAATLAFPFIAGNRLNEERLMQLTIDRSAMPRKAQLLLSLEDDGSHFPLVDFNEVAGEEGDEDPSHGDVIYRERTTIETTFGCCRGVLTLEKGSYFRCHHKKETKVVSVKGGEVVIRNGKRYVRLQESITTVQLEKAARQLYPFSIAIEFDNSFENGNEYTVKVSQQNGQGTTVGGATAVYIKK